MAYFRSKTAVFRFNMAWLLYGMNCTPIMLIVVLVSANALFQNADVAWPKSIPNVKSRFWILCKPACSLIVDPYASTQHKSLYKCCRLEWNNVPDNSYLTNINKSNILRMISTTFPVQHGQRDLNFWVSRRTNPAAPFQLLAFIGLHWPNGDQSVVRKGRYRRKSGLSLLPISANLFCFPKIYLSAIFAGHSDHARSRVLGWE